MLDVCLDLQARTGLFLYHNFQRARPCHPRQNRATEELCSRRFYQGTHLFSILLIVIVIINPSSKHGDYMITAPNQAHVYYNAFTTQQCYNYAIRENFNTSGHITCQNQLMHTTYTAHIL